MKHLSRLFIVALALTTALISCDKNKDENNKILMLVPDKTAIIADGTDKVVFTVQYGDDDVASEAKIMVDGEELQGLSFSASKTGEYKFTATYDGKTSDEVSIIAREGLKLSVDRKVIADDGIDKAVFNVTYDGKDVTVEAQICHADGRLLPGYEFKSTQMGEYAFHAKYDAGSTAFKSNTVAVNVAGFDHTKKLHKNVVYLTFTATWCRPCHYFKELMGKVAANEGDNMVQINLYSLNSEPEVNSTLEDEIAAQLEDDERFTVRYYPTSIVDLRESIISLSTPTEDDILAAQNTYVAYSAGTGIKVNSTINEFGVNAEVTVGAKETGTYYIAVFLVEDNVSAFQSVHGEGYNHTNVARAMATESALGVKLGAMEVGQTIMKEFEFRIDPLYKTDNLHLVVYTLYEEYGKKVIANTVKVPAHGFTDYKYID